MQVVLKVTMNVDTNNVPDDALSDDEVRDEIAEQLDGELPTEFYVGDGEDETEVRVFDTRVEVVR